MFLKTGVTLLAFFSIATFGSAVHPTYEEDETNTQENTTELEEGTDDSLFMELNDSICAVIAREYADSIAALNGELIDSLSIKCSEVIETAMKYLGHRYCRGAAGPKVFDCSGFTSFIFKNFDISLSRDSRAQYTQGVSVERDDLRVGDLVFFTSPRSSRAVGHVGIVSKVEEDGNFHFVHAARRGVVVDDFSTATFYKGRYIGARRVID